MEGPDPAPNPAGATPNCACANLTLTHAFSFGSPNFPSLVSLALKALFVSSNPVRIGPECPSDSRDLTCPGLISVQTYNMFG
jgi:hypothetical protein